MIPLVSSNIRAVDYDVTERELHVEFHNDRLYVLKGVPRSRFIGICRTSSPGRYYRLHLLNRYPCRRLR